MLSETDVATWTCWLRDVARVRSATLDQYESTLSMFLAWCAEQEPDVYCWDEVSPQLIEGFISRARPRAAVPAPATQKRDRAIIGAYFDWARRTGRAKADPVVNVRRPKASERAPKAVSDDIWRRVWGAPLPEEDRVWLGLGCFAGLRRREIVSVSPDQIDPARGLIYGLDRKGGDEDVVEYGEMARIISMRLPQVLPNYDAWMGMVTRQCRGRAGERVLITIDTPGTELSLRRASFSDPSLPDPAVINRQLERVLKMAHLPVSTFSPHALRHTAVTNLLRAGLPIEVVADAVGHKDPNITMRYSKTAGRLGEWRSRLAES